MQLSKIDDQLLLMAILMFIYFKEAQFFFFFPPILFSVVFNAESKPQLGVFFRINNRKNNHMPLSYFSFCLEINKSVSCCFPGLMYVIETQKVMDLKVNLMASYVIVPQTGFYNGTQNIILLDLGHFKV